ncbi:C-GCAxxG-C-C family protein [Terrisporobacter petrolearius]|nr:C-GCAxxG-C-C family protein [Terrisporobacter petrolearius]MCC3865732.1 C-GCAxxG-C-C family protein [Terrisporobacter petrolearius]
MWTDSIIIVTSGLCGGLEGCKCVCGTLHVANISIGLLFSRSEGSH